MHINCPHCQNPIEVVEEPRPNEVVCPSCGSSIPLDPGRTATFFPTTGPRRVGKFEFLEELGVGAFGTVYKARDTELDRLVAIKVPRAGNLATKADVDRFLREARSAAQLKHPSIVAVYDAGQMDGSCYLVSELVHGTTLADRLATKRLSLRESATLVAEIADALDYAHRQGVIHRDLKPSNIMLDLDGKPHVMDFGLAKRDAGEITVTLDGQVLGTPAYMSPEQARGEGHDVDPRCDVYSLGVILYELVTGELPFRGNKRMLIVQVLQDEPRPPCRINDSIPRDLETITLKCLAKEPSRRYGSAGELADDLRRYLKGEPIQARPVSTVERVWRWTRRNPQMATLIGAVALLLIGLALSSTLVALQQKRQRLFAEQTAETERDLRQQADDATALAQKHARHAEDNSAVAREQSQLALKSLNSVIFDIQRKLKNVPGAGDLRRALLQTALARLQEVSDQFASRPVIDRSTMIGLNDLGDVFLRIGSGSGMGFQPVQVPPDGLETHPSDHGPLTAERKVYQQAFDIAQKLAAADPTDAQAQRDLSASYQRLGDASRQAGQVTEARGHYQKFLEISQELAAADPTNAQAQRDLSLSYEKLGDVSRQSGPVTEALGHYRKMHENNQKLVNADPTNAQAQRRLSVSYQKLGAVSHQAGQVAEALGHYQNFLKISEKLAAVDPTDAQAQRDLMVAYGNLGDVSFQAKQVTEALGHYQKALEISQKLEAADPTDGQAQRDLSVSYKGLGDVSLQAGQVTEAIEYYQKDLQFSQKLAAADPMDAQAQRDLSLSYNKLGDVSRQAGQLNEAIVYYQKCLEIRQKLAATDPTDDRAQRDLIISHAKLGLVQNEAKDYGQSVASFETALELARQLKADGKLRGEIDGLLLALEADRNKSQLASTAQGDWKTLLEQPAELLPVLLDMRGTQFVQEGRAREAAQAVAKLRELGTAKAGQLYNAACVYSLCASRLGAAPSLPAEQAAERQKHIADALATLREAIKAGWKDFAHMQKDPDLAPLRDLPEFKALAPKQDSDEKQ